MAVWGCNNKRNIEAEDAKTRRRQDSKARSRTMKTLLSLIVYPSLSPWAHMDRRDSRDFLCLGVYVPPVPIVSHVPIPAPPSFVPSERAWL